jgi:hypothetical protein
MLSVFVDQLQGEAILTALLGFGDALTSDRQLSRTPGPNSPLKAAQKTLAGSCPPQ